jgi:hypothetical protein
VNDSDLKKYILEARSFLDTVHKESVKNLICNTIYCLLLGGLFGYLLGNGVLIHFIENLK